MWEPQPGPQSSALLADWCDELFYGGERGGGKSDFQLGFQEDGAVQYKKDWRGIMFRKTYTELEELQSRAIEIFPYSGAIYKAQSSADYPFSNCWYWPNGATVKMRYIEHERDYGRYHGHQYTGLSMDEVTEYPTPAGLLKMLSTLRSAAGVPCTARLTGNPGGVGHAWVKQRYIDVAPPYTPFTDDETGFTRMFIPSKMSDNVILLKEDPRYRARILASTQGNDVLKKAWLEGDWDIVAGAYFDQWRPEIIIKPFNIPEHWLKFRSFDWGSARPFSVGWWAVVSESYIHNGQLLPEGAMIRYREWYGVKKDKSGQVQPNIGLKMTAEQVGKGIKEKTPKDEKITYNVADPAIFAEDGGPSIDEKMGIGFMPADNKRVATQGHIGGWDQLRARIGGLMPDGDGEYVDVPAMIFTFNTCTDSIRTIPMMQHDEKRIEDINTDMEDHAADEWRYACMSRPYTLPSADVVPEKENRWAKAFKRDKADSWKTV